MFLPFQSITPERVKNIATLSSFSYLFLDQFAGCIMMAVIRNSLSIFNKAINANGFYTIATRTYISGSPSWFLGSRSVRKSKHGTHSPPHLQMFHTDITRHSGAR